VFERFARLDPARENGAGGSGLGLAITLDIIERHGGTIAVEENNGGGASFVVTLPRSRVETARSN
jgi:two-component system OmpR family sensor kinase